MLMFSAGITIPLVMFGIETFKLAKTSHTMHKRTILRTLSIVSFSTAILFVTWMVTTQTAQQAKVQTNPLIEMNRKLKAEHSAQEVPVQQSRTHREYVRQTTQKESK